MSDKFADKYRIKSSRLPEWDYSSGEYFVTICTKDRECYLGEIIDGKMRLNELGNIIDEEIQNTSKIRENVIIDTYVIMPDHIHIIICIEKYMNGCSCRDALHASDKINNKTNETVANRLYKINKNNIFGVQKNNLAAIIRGMKGSITSKIKKINKNFAWQQNYYEHIIRDESELYRIREYIRNNSLQWEIKKHKLDLFL